MIEFFNLFNQYKTFKKTYKIIINLSNFSKLNEILNE